MIVTNEGRLLGKPIRPNISHAYADDTQIYGFCPLSAISVLQEQMSACLDEVALWMRSNRLQLNTAKTLA